MSKYTQKPVTVEAVQFNGHNFDSMEAFGIDDGVIDRSKDSLFVRNFLGDLLPVQMGDWIVKDKDDNLSVFDPKSFDAAFDLAQE